MADRDVKVRLSIEAANDSAAKSLKDVGASAKAAANDVKALNAEQAKLRANPTAAAALPRANSGLPTQPAYQPPARTDPAKQMPQAQQTPPAAKSAAAAQPQGLAEQFGISQANLAQGAQAFAAIKVASEGIKLVAKGIDIFNDETLSAEKKFRKLGESLPVVGEALQAVGALADSLSGKTKALRDIAKKETLSSTESSANLQAFQASTPINAQLSQLKANANAFGQPLNLAEQAKARAEFAGNAPDRSTTQGEVAYQQYLRQAPLKADRRTAEQERDAARQAAADAKQRADDVRAQLAAAERARKAAEAADTGTGSPKFKAFENKTANYAAEAAINYAQGTSAGAFFAGNSIKSSFQDTAKIKSSSDVKMALEDEQKLRQQLITATQQQADAARAAAEAESKVRKANIALAKEELASTKERTAAVSQQASSFGMLSAVDKQAALESAKAFKEKGIDALTPEAKQSIINAGGGAALQKAAIKAAQKDLSFKEFNQLIGQEFDLEGLQQKELDLEAKIDVSINVDKQQLAQELKEVLEPLLKEILESIKAFALDEVKKIKVGQGGGAAAS